MVRYGLLLHKGYGKQEIAYERNSNIRKDLVTIYSVKFVFIVIKDNYIILERSLNYLHVKIRSETVFQSGASCYGYLIFPDFSIISGIRWLIKLGNSLKLAARPTDYKTTANQNITTPLVCFSYKINDNRNYQICWR